MMTNKILWLKWKRNWWKNIGEIVAGLMKNIAEIVTGLMQKYCWNGRWIAEIFLLKWMRDWRNHIAEMEAGLMKNIAEWERDFLIN